MRNPGQLATFLDLIKFAHSIFALPFALIATFWSFRVAQVEPFSAAGWQRLGFILVCMVIARTWAMTFNRLVDRRLDADNPRTARRPSVTGAVSVGFMRGTLVVCGILFLGVTGGWWWWVGNAWPVMLAVPVLGWLAIYSLTKRFTAMCHFWLGASLGLAPLAAWVAIVPPGVSPFDQRGVTIVLLAAGVTFWVAGFDILYALQDEAVDRESGLRSIPAALGRGQALVVSRMCHVATAGFFLGVGLTGGFHFVYWTGYGAAVVLLVMEQALVSARDISRVNVAFMTANGVMGLVFGVMAIGDLLGR